MSIQYGILFIILIIPIIILCVAMIILCKANGCNQYCDKAGTCTKADECRAKNTQEEHCFTPRIKFWKKLFNWR